MSFAAKHGDEGTTPLFYEVFVDSACWKGTSLGEPLVSQNVLTNSGYPARDVGVGTRDAVFSASFCPKSTGRKTEKKGQDQLRTEMCGDEAKGVRLRSASLLSCGAASRSARSCSVVCHRSLAAPNDERMLRIESARHMHQGTALTGPPSHCNTAERHQLEPKRNSGTATNRLCLFSLRCAENNWWREANPG